MWVTIDDTGTLCTPHPQTVLYKSFDRHQVTIDNWKITPFFSGAGNGTYAFILEASN